jgi:electron transfer flavoprotein alpha subunit
MPDAQDIWVVAESDGTRPKEVSLEILCDAREHANAARSAVSVLAFGPTDDGLIAQFGRYGADRVLTAAGTVAEARSAERCAVVIGAALDHEQPRLVLFGATALGRDIAARVAAARRLSLANNCNWVRPRLAGGIEAARLVYGGKLYARVVLPAAPALASVRPGAAGIGKPAPRQPRVVPLPPLSSVAARVEHLGFVAADPRTVDIAEAERIVAVGRGIGGHRAALDLYQRLADRLGASLAASRPMVDAGWLPFERQVGQTGRVVSPRLYLAAGISGASHHTLGMKTSECVVAINRDKNAEIFKLADLKVLADLDEVVPALLQRLEAEERA